MAEAFARVGEIDICYETFGDPSDPAMLLIMGLGTQMLAWHEDFCEQLAARGYFVIRHDNRDIGRSSRLDDLPVPTLKQLALRSRSAAAYTLSDMARDSVGGGAVHPRLHALAVGFRRQTPQRALQLAGMGAGDLRMPLLVALDIAG